MLGVFGGVGGGGYKQIAIQLKREKNNCCPVSEGCRALIEQPEANVCLLGWGGVGGGGSRTISQHSQLAVGSLVPPSQRAMCRRSHFDFLSVTFALLTRLSWRGSDCRLGSTRAAPRQPPELRLNLTRPAHPPSPPTPSSNTPHAAHVPAPAPAPARALRKILSPPFIFPPLVRHQPPLFSPAL